MSFAPTTSDVARGRFLLDLGAFSSAYSDAWAKVKAAPGS